MAEEFIRRPEEIIICPQGNGTGAPFTIDLKAILKAEARVIEVQNVTPMKAGELLATFTICWRELHAHVSQMEFQKTEAQRVVDRVRATILLDKIPEELIRRKMATTKAPLASADVREAIIVMDPDYDEAFGRLRQIEAVVELLRGKLKSFEWAYMSVKKMMGDAATHNYLGGNSHLTGGDTGTNEPGETEKFERPAASPRAASGFGTPRY